jgi:hypothetical protein
MARLKQIVKSYVSRPFRLIATSVSVLAIVLLLFLIDQAYNRVAPVTPEPSSTWLYIVLPRLLNTFIHSKSAVIITAILYLVKSVLIYAVMADVVRIYRWRSMSIRKMMHSLQFNSFVWFLQIESAIFLIFGVAATLSYLLSYFLWNLLQWDTVWLITVLFVALYPAFYALLSMSAFVSVVPLSGSQRTAKFLYLLRGSSARQLYIFFFGRAAVEILIGVIAPAVVIYAIPNPWIAGVIAALLIVVPLALFMGSTLEFKLSLFSGDRDIHNAFSEHYGIPESE